MMRLDRRAARERLLTLAAHVAMGFQRFRLTIDRIVGGVLGRRSADRVVATACWDFPIYSQTFVYQELSQLIHAGFAVRFLYGHLNRRDPLPPQFRGIWNARRRLILHPAVCDRSYTYFTARHPDRVESLVDTVSREAGMSPEEVRAHYHFRQAFAFARMVEAYAPGYLHSYFFYEGSFFALVASHLLGIPRGVSCYADHMLHDYPLKLVPLHLRQTSLTIATSSRIRGELLGIEPRTAASRILVKPNGINVASFPTVGRRQPADGTPFSLVCVSRIEPKKGLVYLVEAVGRLRDRGTRVALHLIGGVDDSDASRAYQQEVRERIRALGLDGVVHLEGRRSEADINAFFRAAHLFVAPFVETESGDKDGIPTALLEGMASGLPVVATNAGSICEVVDDGVEGILVPQRDADALATAIASLLDDPQRRADLGGHSARKIREQFDAVKGERVFHERLRGLLLSPPDAAALSVGS